MEMMGLLPTIVFPVDPRCGSRLLGEGPQATPNRKSPLYGIRYDEPKLSATLEGDILSFQLSSVERGLQVTTGPYSKYNRLALSADEIWTTC